MPSFQSHFLWKHLGLFCWYEWGVLAYTYIVLPRWLVISCLLTRWLVISCLLPRWRVVSCLLVCGCVQGSRCQPHVLQTPIRMICRQWADVFIEGDLWQEHSCVCEDIWPECVIYLACVWDICPVCVWYIWPVCVCVCERDIGGVGLVLWVSGAGAVSVGLILPQDLRQQQCVCVRQQCVCETGTSPVKQL